MMRWISVIALGLALLWQQPARLHADNGYPYPGMIVTRTPHDFDTLWTRMEEAVQAEKMGLVMRASASRFARNRGVDIPGNGVMGVYRNDFAVRMLEASVPAGIRAPLIFYLTENDDGTATLTYQQPSETFRPFASEPLDAMALELDAIFARIAERASGGR